MGCVQLPVVHGWGGWVWGLADGVSYTIIPGFLSGPWSPINTRQYGHPLTMSTMGQTCSPRRGMHPLSDLGNHVHTHLYILRAIGRSDPSVDGSDPSVDPPTPIIISRLCERKPRIPHPLVKKRPYDEICINVGPFSISAKLPSQ